MEPLIFEPYARPQVWGARRLETMLGKRLPSAGTFGESWELSAHPHHVSRVAEGPLAGTLLTDLWRDSARDMAGPGPLPEIFPLLIKLLDCHEQLSVQVHPSDEIAAQLLPGERGKTEAWVILAAEPAGRIYAGLLPGVELADLERHLAAGSVAECLHSFAPRAGDCVFLPAGTVHAVGGGVLMAEVQQSSDATFRLFDWNRPGPDGRPRALHVEQSLASIRWDAGPTDPVRPKPLPAVAAELAAERLVVCPYFELDRFRPRRAFANPYAGRFSIWMVIDGGAELTTNGGYRRRLEMGQTVLIPASATGATFAPVGEPQLLGISLPS
jgi:mannose-6-phosphate isomerase